MGPVDYGRESNLAIELNRRAAAIRGEKRLLVAPEIAFATFDVRQRDLMNARSSRITFWRRVAP
jgi:hypothetical protein